MATNIAHFSRQTALLCPLQAGAQIALLVMAARGDHETQGRGHKDVQDTAGIPATEAGRPLSEKLTKIPKIDRIKDSIMTR
jgi:hypothetical protein